MASEEKEATERETVCSGVCGRQAEPPLGGGGGGTVVKITTVSSCAGYDWEQNKWVRVRGEGGDGGRLRHRVFQLGSTCSQINTIWTCVAHA